MIRTANPKSKPRFRSGALFVIAMLMICSASLRFGLYAGPAIARETSSDDLQSEMKSEPEFISSATSEELQNLIQSLKDRELMIESKEKRIEDQMKALEIAEKAVEQRIQALIEAEKRLNDTLALAEVASESDLTSLTSVYEKMKPKRSAALFEEMDPEFAAGFLARMRPEAAAQIMAGLSPLAAYSVSVVLAGRNASAAKE